MSSSALPPVVTDFLHSLDRGPVVQAASRSDYMAGVGRETPNGVITCTEARQYVDGRGKARADGKVSHDELDAAEKALRGKFGETDGALAATILRSALETPSGGRCGVGVRYAKPDTAARQKMPVIPGVDLSRAQLLIAFSHFPPPMEAHAGLRFDVEGERTLDVLLFRDGRIELWLAAEKGGEPTKLEASPTRARAIAQRLQDFLARENETVMSSPDQASYDELAAAGGEISHVFKALYERAAGQR